MKKTNKTFTFNFSIDGQERVSVLLPEKFQKVFNTMSTNMVGNNSVQELCCFCEEYATLSSDEQAAFQEVIASGRVELWLNSFKDLRTLINSAKWAFRQ